MKNKAINHIKSLHDACREGDHNIVAQLLEVKDIKVNQANKCGETALYWACRRGRADIVAQLLEAKGTDVNRADKDGRTPLYWACDEGHADIVAQLIAKGAKVNRADKDGRTPLHWACRSRNVIIVVQLMENGADVNRADNDGVTPLQLVQEDPMLLNVIKGIKGIKRARLKKTAEALVPFLSKGSCNIIAEYASSDILDSKEIQAIVQGSMAMASIADHKAPLDKKKPSAGQDEKVPARP